MTVTTDITMLILLLAGISSHDKVTAEMAEKIKQGNHEAFRTFFEICHEPY